MDRQTPVLTSDEFGKFFSEYKNRFVSIAYGYVHDTDIAKDIVTDSFMYLWEHREQVNMAENIKGYIYFCVRTRCANHIKEQEVLRRAKNEITKDAYWKLQSSLNSLSSDELSKKLFQSEIIELFSRELAKMPELTRAVYQASRQEGLTYQQIAERYNISTRQVASEMQRAYAQLRVPLKDYLPVIGLLFAMLSKQPERIRISGQPSPGRQSGRRIRADCPGGVSRLPARKLSDDTP